MKYTEAEVRELVNVLTTICVGAMWALGIMMWIVLIVTHAELPILGHTVRWTWPAFAVEGGGATVILAGFLYCLWKDKIRIW